MECREIEKKLDRYIRTELDEPVAEKIREHLSQCEACREKLSIQETLHRLLAEPEEMKAPMDFTFEIMKKIQKIKPSQGVGKLFYRGWGRSLIAAGLLMFIINFVGISQEINYDKLFYKTSAMQRSILFSLEEMNRTIIKTFNHFDTRGWRD